MKIAHPIALSVAMMFGVACGHEEPSKTAHQAATTPNPAQAAAPAAAIPVAGLTSAGVPREGRGAGNAEAQPVDRLTDGEILQVTHTANLGEMAQAKLALLKTKDARVRSLAQMMVQDHSQADSRGMILAKKEDVDREPSPTSESLETEARDATRALRTRTGTDFDKDYVDMQVREHEAVLATLDQKLIVSAANPALKAYLVEVRAAIAAHLEHAQDLQRDLQK